MNFGEFGCFAPTMQDAPRVTPVARVVRVFGHPSLDLGREGRMPKPWVKMKRSAERKLWVSGLNENVIGV